MSVTPSEAAQLAAVVNPTAAIASTAVPKSDKAKITIILIVAVVILIALILAYFLLTKVFSIDIFQKIKDLFKKS
jgi:flagellar basal body-associated protein FliL